MSQENLSKSAVIGPMFGYLCLGLMGPMRLMTWTFGSGGTLISIERHVIRYGLPSRQLSHISAVDR